MSADSALKKSVCAFVIEPLPVRMNHPVRSELSLVIFRIVTADQVGVVPVLRLTLQPSVPTGLLLKADGIEKKISTVIAYYPVRPDASLSGQMDGPVWSVSDRGGL